MEQDEKSALRVSAVSQQAESFRVPILEQAERA
jgi:hypothetical protein